MRDVKVLPTQALGYGFIPREYLPEGEDEHYLRDAQVGGPGPCWRHLRSDEIEDLVKNGVTCDDWDGLRVTDPFTPHLIKNSEFSGLVRIGRLENVVLEHHELKTPAGITNSLIISCDIGENVAIHNVRYLAHFIIGDNVILLNVDEMNTTNHAKFGNGIVKEGEPENARVWMNLMNETGGRAVLPFDGMIPADAYLWAKYRDDVELQERFRQITERQFDPRRGFYGEVGSATVIKNSRILKDVKIGARCYIKGANKLKNLTIHSSDEEPTQIGEGVELVNGIVGPGSRIFYGCKAVRFVAGSNTTLKYGARLIHSCLGDNSTVSCCEILNNLVFPAHEQHHNNSFLAASLVMGQSNVAAGATIGSNHNSRANDGEIQAGRGFWPGLCTTLKHSSRFASFVLLAQGDYPAELDVPLPFALLSNDAAGDRLLVMPAYWWLYNMYALARNTWKFRTRDRRKTRTQHVEFDCLAPDTAEEMLRAMRLLEIWTAKAHRQEHAVDGLVSEPPGATEGLAKAARAACGGVGRPAPSAGGVGRAAPTEGSSDDELAALGRDLLVGPAERTAGLEILGHDVENSRRKVVIVKARPGYHAYREMLHYYAMKNLLEYLRERPDATPATLGTSLAGPRETAWVNLGGQLARERDVDQLRSDVRLGKLNTWSAIHQAYDRLWEAYPAEKQRHALSTLLTILGHDDLTPRLWKAALEEAVRIQEHVRREVYRTRKKDYDNPYRQATFRNAEEMRAVVGTAEDNAFVKQVRHETESLKRLVEAVRKRSLVRAPLPAPVETCQSPAERSG